MMSCFNLKYLCSQEMETFGMNKETFQILIRNVRSRVYV